MEKTAYITGILCIAVFIMGLFYQLGGFEKTERIIRFVTAVCIVSMLFNSIRDFELTPFIQGIQNETEQYNFEDSFYSSVISETQAELEDIIKKRLSEKNISYNSVEVHILEQNGNLTAGEIIVSCDKKYADTVYGCISDIATENTKINIGD
ncbi:MAG: hypothetical protein IKA10_08025 [Oscillospiraceae bacterium]|nr:hypothetical protein [Oscillospiraceae bacterium]